MEAPLQKIIQLLKNFQEHQISVQVFCTNYEETWNFGVTRENVPSDDYSILSALFDEIVLYSPFPKSQWDYPKYRTEDEIYQAVATASKGLAKVRSKGG